MSKQEHAEGAYSARDPWDEIAKVVGKQGVGAPTLHELHALKLLLRGESVVDWHRLYVTSLQEVRGLFWLNGLDLEDPIDRERLQDLRDKAHDFIRSTLRLKVQEELLGGHDASTLPQIASSEGKLQHHACLLLKVMHVIHHLEARELRTWLPVSDNDLFLRVESSVLRALDALRAAGLPSVEFSWSRKQPNSLITKLLLKRDTIAAQVFDRLRFRVIVQDPKDLEPSLRIILQRCIPFNFVVPGQTVNTLLDARAVRARAHDLGGEEQGESEGEESSNTAGPNEYSSSSFRILNFVADLPVRVDRLLDEHSIDPLKRGRVVFVLAEFQICDQATAQANEEGPSAHANYKARQLAAARERLLRRPSMGKQPADEELPD